MEKLILGFFLLLFAGCDSYFSGGDSSEAYSVEVLENASQSEWSSANFKALPETFREVRSLEDVKHLLSKIQARGVKLKIAWYRNGTSSCGNLAVVVPPQLLISIDQGSVRAELARYFEPIEGDADLFCPNSVHKIIPMQSFN